MIRTLTDGPRDAATHLIFAHGAGAGMKSVWLAKFATLAAEAGLCVHRFDFAYMAARAEGGSRRPPPRAETLTGEYEEVVAQVAAEVAARSPAPRIVIGGKSMGGRVASMVADKLYAEGRIAGLVCTGYPFHPVGQPTKLRTAHLAGLQCPTLILQGTRDAFGTREEVANYTLSDAITLHWFENADHDFRGAGRGTMDTVVRAIADFATA